jgi:ATPase family AAA domain-containing protein 3A/B
MRTEKQTQFKELEKLRVASELKLLKEKAALESQQQKDKQRMDARIERQNEDVRSRARKQQGELDNQKAVAVARETLSAFGKGAKALLTDPQQLTALVSGLTVLIVAAFSAREAAKLARKQAAAILGKPSLVRETSRVSILTPRHAATTMSQRLGSISSAEHTFEDVVLEKKLEERVVSFATATKNTKKNKADFRHLCLYGPPGTGKTLVAKKLARFSGLDYAIMSGGDVLPLGSDGVTQIHAMFEWAQQSRRGVLLFIDEAEAFLAQRSSEMSEHQRNALNALLFQTGTQSRHFMLVLATNRPADLDAAVIDRMDEMIEFPLPTFFERQKLLKLFFEQTLNRRRPGHTPIRLEGIGPSQLNWVAGKTEGYSGRLLSKLMISVQGHVFGLEQPTLNSKEFLEVVEMKLESMNKRRNLLALQEAYLTY